ncbi:MAG: GNAT family N-acetyltransferase [Candidatus Dactylopiibacterium sp.]|nr:GNAT family N-acetyltransferase [Candidatus Dactylopiibacterium sp.]
MTARIVCRAAQAGDLTQIAALLGGLFAIERDFRPDAARQLAALRLLLAREDALLWVADAAREGGEVVGFCSVQRLVSTAEGGAVGLVEDVVVDAAWRARGIGRALLEGAEAWARRQGMSRLQLLADEDNPAAARFYDRLGWARGNMRNRVRLLR